MRMATLHRLNYVRKGHLVAVRRDDLVGQYIGQSPRRQKRSVNRPWAECSSLTRPIIYRQENERDYGQEAIEILLEEWRISVTICCLFRGRKGSYGHFFESNPGISSRIADHLEFQTISLMNC